jgi:hypothetical protein
MAYVDGFPGDAGTTTVVRSLGSFSAAGVPGWTNGASYLNDQEGDFDWGHQFALDRAGNAFVAGEFTGSLALGALGSLTAVGPTDVEVKVLDTSGALRAAGSWGGDGEGSPWSAEAVPSRRPAGDSISAPRTPLRLRWPAI